MPSVGTVLVVNPGSSSLKLSLLDETDSTLIASEVEAEGGRLDDDALGRFLDRAPAIEAAGVRVVHGGPDLRAPTLVDAGVVDRLDQLADLAPLHNPPAVAALRALRRHNMPVVACFDTAFHATLSDAATTYAVPAEWRERWGIRRYGFHGLSHAWASRRAAELLGREPSTLRLVSCHLGSGASLAAVRDGECVDTTMGFTPMEGLVMGTRSGSIDPGAMLWLMRRAGLPPERVERALDRESGLAGIAGSADMRAVLAAEERGDPHAHLAVEVYLHRLRSLIGAMAVTLGRLDALVFTGGVGEHSAAVRQRCCAGLGLLGVSPALRAPEAVSEDTVISPDGAAVAVLTVHAREDLQIAAEVRALMRSSA